MANFTTITIKKEIHKKLWDLKYKLGHRRIDTTILHLITRDLLHKNKNKYAKLNQNQEVKNGRRNANPNKQLAK